MKIKSLLFALVIGIVLLGACSAPAPETPTPTQTSTPRPVTTPTPTLAETTTTPGLPDLVWIGKPTVEPLAPIVGDRFHVKQSWINAGAAATSSDFEISVHINKGNAIIFEQLVKVPQPVRPGESRTLDIAPDYALADPGGYKVVLTLDPKKMIVESSNNSRIIESDIEQVPDLSAQTNFVKGIDATRLAQAEKDIEKYRKGDVTLTVINATGNPCPGLKINYSQTQHSFLFGVFYGAADIKGQSLMKEAGINYIPVVLSWKGTEPQPGTFNLPMGSTEPLQRLGQEGMGHCLIFLNKDLTWSTPDYLTKLTFDDYKNSIYTHFYKIVSAYKQDIKVWNIFNEPMTSLPSVIELSEQQTLDIIKEAARAVHDADPGSHTLINIGAPFGEQAKLNGYDFLRNAAGIDFDTIGLEFYYNAYTSSGLSFLGSQSLSSMADLVDKYSTLGKKIQITELSVPSDSNPGMQGYWDQPWSQDLQAEYLKVAYTLFFSKPDVEGITWWNATDTNAFIYHGALLDDQDTPKKSYFALKQLIKSWTTSGTTVTDDKGQVSFRGFGGSYEVTVTDNKTGLSKKQVITVDEQQQNSITIVLN